MVSQLYVDGITDTVSHGITSTLTAGQIEITAGQEAAAADHSTFRYAETVTTVSEICTGCGKYYSLSTEADQVMRVADQQDGTGRALVQCKDIEACYVRWSSIVTYF